MTTIRILEKDNNRRGDLFGRLMADLFVALGYDQPRLNVHKSGREVDLTANHRLESRRAIGECKATADPVGGDELNKFVGVLDAEKSDDDRALTGYFISLGGFRETAIEQQRRRQTKFVMLTAGEVIDELIKGRILVAKDRAAELAGRLCGNQDHLALDATADLLAHARGWIWAIYYTDGKFRTSFALIHADGTPLARPLADEVIAADQVCKGTLHRLTCLNPALQIEPENDPCRAEALAGYANYLANECGFIQLDGMPTDNDVGSRRLRLENLFVPLHLDIGKGEAAQPRQPFGAVLASNPRLAILAAPGGGKSTLLKRLAVAYADPVRHRQIQDGLPQRNWLPLFFRCRELRDLARASFAELLAALSQREGVRQNAVAFLAHVDRAFLAGEVILLIDGLDEISDPGDRAAFVSTLRTALQAHPNAGLVITSREAGFRHVAAHLAPVCTFATLSSFNWDDIRRLSVAWHREVVGDTEKVRTDAERLATTISNNDRIRLLAVNPLLLTTLLLVRRWVGQLPTRRAVLYGEAVKVLIRTWNTEGHDPLPEEETIPQLCYVASAMMLRGIQKVSRPHLAALLQEAREALPMELGYVRGTVEEFIHRVEDRSSLLMMSGHDVEDGQLLEFFEFRHLTFQEFLTARAMVEGWYPGRRESDSLSAVLLPYFEKEGWREVTPLAAVMGGKATEALIQSLSSVAANSRRSRGGAIQILRNCLADEAAARPETIREAMRVLVHNYHRLESHGENDLATGRFGEEFRNEARLALLSSKVDLADSVGALLDVVWWQSLEEDASDFGKLTSRFLHWLKDGDFVAQCEGALGFVWLCFELANESRELLTPELREAIALAGPALTPLIFSDDAAKQYAGSFALFYLGQCEAWTLSEAPDVLGRLFILARTGSHLELRQYAARALACHPLDARTKARRFTSVDSSDLSAATNGLEDDDYGGICLVIVSWYRRLLADAELIRRINKLLEVVETRGFYPAVVRKNLEKILRTLKGRRL